MRTEDILQAESYSPWCSAHTTREVNEKRIVLIDCYPAVLKLPHNFPRCCGIADKQLTEFSSSTK
ncbi:hypothetical protein T190_31320 [Sinorhizobium meliloti CCBAU 01290]|nr:hypothetical protein T190_31320 [Sinorhizobium meliloti CCBAU 01290]